MFATETTPKNARQTGSEAPKPPSESAGNGVSIPPADDFVRRHLGPDSGDIQGMLGTLECASLDDLIDQAVPAAIRTRKPLQLPHGLSEHAALAELRAIAARNKVFRSYLGMGYHDCLTPPVVQRNILENPGWYTQYTPYQAEIAQGRLEALLNFQTLVCDLTGMQIANASLLDEATAAAEAMALCFGTRGNPRRNVFLVAADCHPQTIDVVRTRAEPLGIQVQVKARDRFNIDPTVFGLLVQYPTTYGEIPDYASMIDSAHEAGAMAVVAADLLSLTLLRPPGEFGSDIVVGSAQRFGVPLGYGGPHAAFFATRDTFKRQMPGRLVGVSRDSLGRPALRLTLQTREQHIRREKATSNICTAQVLLANIASMYAVYHGPDGLRRIARRVHLLTATLAEGLRELGCEVGPALFFDTLRVGLGKRSSADIAETARTQNINLRVIDPHTVGVSLDETVTEKDLVDLLQVFHGGKPPATSTTDLLARVQADIPAPHARTTGFLGHPVFNSYHSETELLRYIRRLESRDLSLTTSMIPLGSCTMKLNATAEMLPLSWPEFSRLHPFAPLDQTQGYQILFRQLEQWLAEITGFQAVSLQPNAGSQGEFAGLLVIRRYHASRKDSRRNVCLIPTSAHGTNPASAVMAGMEVVAVKCDASGNIDVPDLRAKAREHREDLAALMITYPSTHGVFEETVSEICEVIHEHGGQVYMDGANLNAQVGLCRPGEIGADVCHLNLHKTFCIPHGGGGPGMGPIAVASHLAPFLPGHPVIPFEGSERIGAVSAAPWGSPSILTIS
ncbi:MAG TPA: aminomethyl-transferring glycine dehydrogenase, partial [Methylomirabilota bacterium]|nr:aminomethyl-transferring glycine dehydrogenase [Methylomirabilota bacterium]